MATTTTLHSSRIEAGQTQYQLERVSLKEVVKGTVLMVTPQATAKHIAVSVSDPGNEVMAKADRSLPRLAGLEERFLAVMPDLLEGVTPDDLRGALVKVLAPKPAPKVDLDHVAPIRISGSGGSTKRMRTGNRWATRTQFMDRSTRGSARGRLSRASSSTPQPHLRGTGATLQRGSDTNLRPSDHARPSRPASISGPLPTTWIRRSAFRPTSSPVPMER